MPDLRINGSSECNPALAVLCPHFVEEGIYLTLNENKFSARLKHNSLDLTSILDS
jgi:hypothetical protein